jgi:hypothetical protein
VPFLDPHLGMARRARAHAVRVDEVMTPIDDADDDGSDGDDGGGEPARGDGRVDGGGATMAGGRGGGGGVALLLGPWGGAPGARGPTVDEARAALARLDALAAGVAAPRPSHAREQPAAAAARPARADAAFLVVDGARRLRGLLLRDQLEELVEAHEQAHETHEGKQEGQKERQEEQQQRQQQRHQQRQAQRRGSSGGAVLDTTSIASDASKNAPTTRSPLAPSDDDRDDGGRGGGDVGARAAASATTPARACDEACDEEIIAPWRAGCDDAAAVPDGGGGDAEKPDDDEGPGAEGAVATLDVDSVMNRSPYVIYADGALAKVRAERAPLVGRRVESRRARERVGRGREREVAHASRREMQSRHGGRASTLHRTQVAAPPRTAQERGEWGWHMKHGASSCWNPLMI